MKNTKPIAYIYVGTHCYTSRAAAERHYAGDTDLAIAEGRIAVGRPPAADGADIVVFKDEGRYAYRYRANKQE